MARPLAALLLLLAASSASGQPRASAGEPPADGAERWAGPYLGAHLAFARGAVDSSVAGPTPQQGTASYGGLEGGIQAGWGRVLRSRFLLGLEADLSVPEFFDTSDRMSLLRTGDRTVEERLECLGSARARVGYVRPGWTLYGAGGLAWAVSRFSRAPGASGSDDTAWRMRPGWTVGAGAALALSPAVSARLEYRYDQLERAEAAFAAGDRASSRFGLHRLFLGLDWYPGAGAPGRGANDRGELEWNLHGQLTFVGQGYPSFRSPYAGANSLSGASQFQNTESATLFFGLRAWRGGELYVNPELMRGFGLSDVHGVAAFPNGEAQKSSFLVPRVNVARLFLSQTFSLGGPTEKVEDEANQIAGERSVSRVTVVVGKVAVTDYFLVNDVAGEPRTTFLNWNIYGGGSYDWTMDRLSWTWGALIDLNQPRYALRAGYFLLPKEANGNHFDTHIPDRGQFLAEGELRYALRGRPGKVLVTGWLNHGWMGSYLDALAQDPAAAGYPDITLTRRVRYNYGFVIGAQQAVSRDLGLFSRVTWNAGHVEMMGWTDCNLSLSLGATLAGRRWSRPHDTVGLAGVVEGLSSDARRYLAAGGMGILIGDGRLTYGPEGVVEAYYAYSPARWVTLSVDYQLIVNPGYNSDRGPVSVFSLRAHVAF